MRPLEYALTFAMPMSSPQMMRMLGLPLAVGVAAAGVGAGAGACAATLAAVSAMSDALLTRIFLRLTSTSVGEFRPSFARLGITPSFLYGQLALPPLSCA